MISFESFGEDLYVKMSYFWERESRWGSFTFWKQLIATVGDILIMCCHRCAFQCTLQQYVDDLFLTILRVDSTLPPAVKYLFDFLDTAARRHNLVDPEVLHTWKSNRWVGRNSRLFSKINIQWLQLLPVHFRALKIFCILVCICKGFRCIFITFVKTESLI